MPPRPADDDVPAEESTDCPSLYTEAEAEAIWARAAQLHAEADTRTRLQYGLTDPLTDDGQRTATTVVPPTGMFLDSEIVSAAREAGIDVAHVRLAMAEHDAASRETTVAPTDEQRRLFRRELGTDTGSVRAVTYVPGAPDTVITMLRDACGRSPWGLEFEGCVLATADVGQVLRFRVPLWLGDPNSSPPRPANVTNAFVYNANRIGVMTVHVTVAARGSAESPSCEVSVVADLRLGQHLNLGYMRLVGPLFAGSLVCGGAALAMVLATPNAPIFSLPALVGAIAGSVLAPVGVALLRRVMRWEQRTAMAVLEREFRCMLGEIGRPRAPLASGTVPSQRLAAVARTLGARVDGTGPSTVEQRGAVSFTTGLVRHASAS